MKDADMLQKFDRQFSTLHTSTAGLGYYYLAQQASQLTGREHITMFTARPSSVQVLMTMESSWVTVW